MTDLTVEPVAREIAHLSHSQVSSYTRCGEAYRLQKIAGVREKPAYWSIGGSAVHTAIEHYEIRRFDDDPPPPGELVEVFRRDLAERYDAESGRFLDDDGRPDPNVWRAGGRASKAWPNKEDLAWWRENGATMLENFHSWRSIQPYEIMEMPDGSPAVEVMFEITFPETAFYRALKIKGAIDAVVAYNTGVIGVRDYKSGSRTPDSSSQLGLYALALDEVLQVRPSFGDYYMTRKTETTTPDPLTQWTRECLHASYDAVLRAREAGAFVPNPGQFCTTCGVRDFCRIKGQPEKSARFATVGLRRTPTTPTP